MTFPGTGTVTRTAAITMVDVRDVMWRIQSDLRTLRAQHGMITESFETNASADLLQWVYRNFVSEIRFEFLRNGVVQPGSIAYSVSRHWEGADSDLSGGLRYRDLCGLTFSITTETTSLWRALTPAGQAEFYGQLQCSWGPAARSPVAGVWTADRTYGSGALGATRLVLR